MAVNEPTERALRKLDLDTIQFRGIDDVPTIERFCGVVGSMIEDGRLVVPLRSGKKLFVKLGQWVVAPVGSRREIFVVNDDTFRLITGFDG